MKIKPYTEKIILQDLKNQQFQKGLNLVGLNLKSDKEPDLFSIVLDIWEIHDDKIRELAFMHYFACRKLIPVLATENNAASLEILSQKLNTELQELSRMASKQ
tara:strand:- start:3151 stop:3459 length:309 start_codon:yes stop_codon:yes gene_type:complete